MEAQGWVVAGTLATAVGTGWQAWLAASMGTEGLKDFWPALREIGDEEAKAKLKTIPWHRFVARRRAVNGAIAAARDLLTKSELRRSKLYDSQGYAWSLLMVGAMFGAGVALFS